MKRCFTGVSSMFLERNARLGIAENAASSGLAVATEEIVVKYFEKTIFCAFHCYCFVVE